MTPNFRSLIDLGHIEDELYATVLEYVHLPPSKELDDKLQVIYKKYCEVHSHYAQLAEDDMEALKRGLFIQWYGRTEPGYLTGIDNINAQSEETIIQILNDAIKLGNMDDELKWMLNYYANWRFTFDQFSDCIELMAFIENKSDDLIPRQINRELMKCRGQMGYYWNSLTRFK